MSETKTPTDPAAGTEPAAETPQAPPSVLHFSDLLLGAVPVLAGLMLVGVIVWENTQPLTPRYEAQVKTFLEQKKLPEAQACLKRLLNLHPERDDLRFTLAQVYIAQGRGLDGEELIRAMARSDKRGYLPAHHWQAQQFAQIALSSPQAAKEAEGHLKILVEAAPDPRPYKAALGELYFRTQRPAEAVPYLTDVAKDNAAVLMALSHCKEQLGRKDGAAKLGSTPCRPRRRSVRRSPALPSRGWSGARRPRYDGRLRRRAEDPGAGRPRAEGPHPRQRQGGPLR
ncbi:MAG: tetratricopeptide repeat protein [Isosphaeraceae bacterium]